MKNNCPGPERLDRAATLEEVRIATLLQTAPGLISSGPGGESCDVISEDGEHTSMLWFELELFAEFLSNSDPTIQ